MPGPYLVNPPPFDGGRFATRYNLDTLKDFWIESGFLHLRAGLVLPDDPPIFDPPFTEDELSEQQRPVASDNIDNGRDAINKEIRAAAALLVDELNIIYGAMSRGIASITRSGTVATATTPTPHGLSNDTIGIFGADQSPYNGQKAITVTGTTSFTFTVTGNPVTPATGTILYVLNTNAPPLSRTLQQAYNALKTKINAGSVD